MTLDANAAVEGCLKAGATEGIVSDDGFGGVNMIPELFHSEAEPRDIDGIRNGQQLADRRGRRRRKATGENMRQERHSQWTFPLF